MDNLYRECPVKLAFGYKALSGWPPGSRLKMDGIAPFREVQIVSDDGHGRAKRVQGLLHKQLITWIIHKIIAQNTYLSENTKGKMETPHEE
jgi:hypothetical protein